MKTVTLNAVQSVGWGGKYWGQLKRDITMQPSWEKLQTSQIWTDKAQFAHLHVYLSGQSTPVTSESQNVITEMSAQVNSLSIQIADTQKVFMYGPAASVVSVAKPKVILFDTEDSDQTPEDIVSIATADNTATVIIMGDQGPAERILEAIQRKPTRQGQQVEKIVVFVDHEPAFAPTTITATTKRIDCIILTPIKNRTSHRGYIIVRGLGWRPSIMFSILKTLALSEADATMRNLVFIPNSKRTLSQIVERLAMHIVHLPNWQFMLGYRGPIGDPAVLASEVTAACNLHTSSVNPAIMSRELLKMWEGNPVSPEVMATIQAEVSQTEDPTQATQSKKRKRPPPPDPEPQSPPRVAGSLTKEGQKEMLKKMAVPSRKKAPPKEPTPSPSRSPSPSRREQFQRDREMAEQLEKRDREQRHLFDKAQHREQQRQHQTTMSQHTVVRKGDTGGASSSGSTRSSQSGGGGGSRRSGGVSAADLLPEDFPDV